MLKIIHYSEIIYKQLKELKLCLNLSHIAIKHILSILISMFMTGYRGKTIDFARFSENHRTTIAHFFNHGKWNDAKLSEILKSQVIKVIYDEAKRSGKPIFCIVDDTISSKTKPSSQALNPIENAAFHYSHLKNRQDYGHQAISVLLSCNGITLNYTVLLCDKSKSKIQMICDLANELPIAPTHSYLLCDCWYTSSVVMNSFVKRGFYTIGGLKSNRIIYPLGIRQNISQFAMMLQKTDVAVRLVTVGNRQYYVYRYQGKLNKLNDAVVLITYPKDKFLNTKALRAFVCTNSALTTEEILQFYCNRWQIEIYFRNCKTKLAFDKCQIRSAQGVRRFWLITSLAYYICCMSTGKFIPFDDGYHNLQSQIHRQYITFVYTCGAKHLPLDDLLSFAA